MYPPIDPNDQTKKKPVVDSSGLDPGLGTKIQAPTTFTLGDPNAAPPAGIDASQLRPNTAPAPSVGGSADFPSLPAGATPPPGYVDPVTGKTAGAAPAAPAAPGAAPPATGTPSSLPPGATPPPGYVDPVTGQPPAPAAPGSPAAPGAPAAPVDPNAPPTTVNDAYKKALIDGLSRGVPTLDDPTLAPAIAANRGAQQRAAERQRSILAEHNAQSGTGDSGGATAQNLGIEADRAQQEGQFEGNALLTAAQQQRDDLLHWAQLAGIDENSEEGRQLQSHLADLDAQIKREQIASSEKLGTQDIDLRRYGIDTQGRLGEGGLNNDLLRILLQNQQYGQGLGANVGEFNANRDDMNFWKSLGLI